MQDLKDIDLDDPNCEYTLVWPEPTCMYCGRHCDETEVVYTGDDEAPGEVEGWCYCPYCQKDTFHRLELIKKEELFKNKKI